MTTMLHGDWLVTRINFGTRKTGGRFEYLRNGKTYKNVYY